MTEYTLDFINRRVTQDPKGFIEESEARYRDEVARVAEDIARDSRIKPIVLINGPSSSGKTTTANRLYTALEKLGIHAKTISMDDYYRTVGSYEVPQDPENGVPDLESPECMDLRLLSLHLQQLGAGEEIVVPRFDFETRTSHPGTEALRLGKDEVVLIEGIHSFNPLAMGEMSHSAVGVYLSIASALLPAEGERVEPYMLRFLRRAARDSLFRSSPVEDTLRQWNSVRRGERLYISPYRGQASLSVDTFVPYELCILMAQLQTRLSRQQDALERAGLSPVAALLGQVEPIAYERFLPADSVLHEFIG